MIFGYARVSTDAQDLTAQLKDLKAAGCERVFKEKISGATADRPRLKKLMATVEHGDVVIIPAVDRLSRDTTGSFTQRYVKRHGQRWSVKADSGVRGYDLTGNIGRRPSSRS
jgi:DNA invertase Pin-like site-specific DNA recombinase